MRFSIGNPQHDLPFVIEPEDPSRRADDALEWWRQNRDFFDDKLHRHGAVLFRGFDVADQETLQRVTETIGGKTMNYVDGNSPRTRVGGGVYTSTEYPAEFFISMHNELSYSATWPSRLFFCCVTPPQEGGETPLADSRRILQRLTDDVRDEFRARGVTYIRNLHAGNGFGPSWMKTFETEDRGVVEEHARNSGMDLEWLDDGSARLSCTRPATARHPRTGEEVWFNQADQFHPSTHPKPIYDSMVALYKGREDRLPQYVTFGDGSPIDPSALDRVRQVTREQLVLTPWRKGDLVVVDNMLVSHGRMPFKGPRKILVAMSAN